MSVAVAWSVESCLPTRRPGFDSRGVRNFNFYPGTVSVSFICVLFCVVSGGGPASVLTTHSGRSALVYLSSVLVHSLFFSLQASDPWYLTVPGVCVSYIGGG